MGEIIAMNLKLHSSQWVSKYNKSNNRDLIFSFKILDLLNRKRSVWIGENYQIIKTKICELEYGPFLYFQSGGTSGKPKWIQHNRTSMRNAVHGLKNYLELENISSWCCLPLNHVGGMMQVIRAIETNGKVFFIDYRDLFDECQISPKGSWISLVPTQLFRLIKDDVACINLRKFEGIFLGGAALTDSLAEECRGKCLPVYSTYGMTETCGMVSILKKEDFLNGETGVGCCLPHAEIQSRPKDKRLLVKSESMALNLSRKVYDDEERLLTPDFGTQNSRGSWHILGRADRVIISGGKNINLIDVEKILLECNMVESCLITVKRDEEWGDVIHAHITPKNVKKIRLIEYAKNNLPFYSVPKKWEFCDELPLSQMGKPKV